MMPPPPARQGLQPLDAASAAGFVAYSASVTVTPVALVILAREMQFSLTAGGGLEALRSVLLLTTLLISGALAGRWGKAPSLGVSCLALGFGMLVYCFAPTYGAVLIAMAVLGVGGGVIEALINPLIQDLHPGNSGRYLNFINAFWSVGVLATVLITGDLLTREVSWRAVIAGLGVLSMAAGALFLLLARTGPPAPRHSLREVAGHKVAALRSGRFWLFLPMMFLAGAAEGAFTFWSASLVQLHFGGTPRGGGFGTALFATGMIAGRIGSAWLVGQQRLRRLLLTSAAATTVVAALIPFAGSLGPLYLLLFLAGLSVACFWPSLQSYAADRVPVDATALFILLSCGGIPGFAFASWVMGWMGDLGGLMISFWCVPAFSAGLFLLLAMERALVHRPTLAQSAGSAR
ncbi:MAG: MFS transporter [Puniceicoccaceae bacterium]|nr:MAG: MFS transporter [Puniceicoccaceae bacterium]